LLRLFIFLTSISSSVILYRFRNCTEPVLYSYASGDASYTESPDAASFTLSYALSSKRLGLF
jgi:hypothetical protein